MTEKFKQQIKSSNKQLFYNSSGDPRAYKLNIRHLSASSFSGLATLIDGYIVPKSNIYLVDLKKETIRLAEEKVKLIKLENIK